MLTINTAKPLPYFFKTPSVQHLNENSSNIAGAIAVATNITIYVKISSELP